MEQHVEAILFNPRGAISSDSKTRSSEGLASDLPFHQPYRKDSTIVSPNLRPSPLRPSLRLGCTSPRGSNSPSTKQNLSLSTLNSLNSFEQLYHEKAYLTLSLHNQNEREIQLMRRLSILQDKFENGQASDERRNSRKKMAMLKSKIIETTAQKKVILLRLDDIYLELQSRHTWIQVRSELYEARYSSCYTGSPNNAYPSTPSDVTSMIPTPLDAASPAFFPMRHHPIYAWEAAPTHSSYTTDYVPPIDPWTNDDENLDLNADNLGNRGLQFAYEVQNPGSQSADDGVSYVSGSFLATLKERRLSLPPLRCLWPGSQETCELDFTANSGFS
ncbi:hypothetical protein CCHL11_00338 [Colletotrichum chlorophyti]|uniref:Uncharacterized protein n=1 Tax=Colletotrichum chlorophyti TaxID=708187 RepID=A0A1Q8RU28_9PEZI|nr:hypothetical protein CCHL11_00338 [Colletotrichum chlorophyti]